MPITGHSVSVTKSVKTSMDNATDKVESLMNIFNHCRTKEVKALEKMATSLKPSIK